MIFAQSTSSDDPSVIMLVRSLFMYSLYDPCHYCPQSFLAFLLNTGGQQIRSQMNEPLREARAHTLFKLQTKLSCILTGIPYFLVKNNTPLFGKFFGHHHHQNGLGHMLKPPNESFETSVFLELVPSQKRKSKKSNAKEFLSTCFTF